jgi:hypothetical protein
MKNAGALEKLLDMMGAIGEGRKGIKEMIFQLGSPDPDPSERVTVWDDYAKQLMATTFEGLGFTVVQFSAMASLDEVKEMTDKNGRGLYIIHLPMDNDVRNWVARSFDYTLCKKRYVWAVTGTNEELVKAGFPSYN